MNTLVHYSLQDNIAAIRIDDGKRNALSPAVLRELYQALVRKLRINTPLDLLDAVLIGLRGKSE